MRYTIPAIPTTYRGRKYRSRLEARWAAFFDLLGWNAEYEPLDLGKWSPDFAVWGSRQRHPVLVEVKPILAWDRETARKMADAVFDNTYAPPTSFCLLVGVEPSFGGEFAQIGWLAQSGGGYEAEWTEALFGAVPGDRYDICANSESFGSETLLWEMAEIPRPAPFENLWASAANAVQWQPKAHRK